MFGRIPLCCCLTVLLFAGNFFFIWLNTNSISLLMTGLFRLSISSWFSVGRLYISRNLSISPRLFSLLACNCWILLCFFVLMYYQFLFLFILFIWVFSLFFLMSLTKGSSILSFQRSSSGFIDLFSLFFFFRSLFHLFPI